MTDETKQCPFCGETINAIAQKCRFCGTWLNENKIDNTQEQPKTKQCPYCGEKILSIAVKCKYCGEYFYISHSNQNLHNINNPIICQLAKMQKTSNILWIVISIIMIIIGYLCILFHDNRDFLSNYPYGPGFALFQGISYLILGIYNLCHVPIELPNKILKADNHVVKYYENITSFVVALVINIILCWFGAILVGFDLYIRSVVIKNKNLFFSN